MLDFFFRCPRDDVLQTIEALRGFLYFYLFRPQPVLDAGLRTLWYDFSPGSRWTPGMVTLWTWFPSRGRVSSSCTCWLWQHMLPWLQYNDKNTTRVFYTSFDFSLSLFIPSMFSSQMFPIHTKYLNTNRSCQAWLSDREHWCSSHRYQPSVTASWEQVRWRYLFLWVPGLVAQQHCHICQLPFKCRSYTGMSNVRNT